jgi:acetyltransferase-like isoleucine patch superfamily enzyme
MTRYRDGYKGGKQKYDFSLRSILRISSLLIIPIITYTIGLFPLIYMFLYVVDFVSLSNIIHLFLFTNFLVILFFLFIIFETFIPGLVIRIFRIKADEGKHELSILDWNFYKYSLFFALYRPSLKIIGVFPLIPLRIRFLKLVGLQMGKSSMVSGAELIHDPYMIEIGEQTLIGGGTHIAGHLGEKKLIIKKVKIGDHCLIGAKSFIMPGVVIENNVTVALNSVVIKDMRLKKGGTYAGIPVKEIVKRKT